MTVAKTMETVTDMSSMKILVALALLVTGTTNCEERREDDGIVTRDTCAKVCALTVCDGVTEVAEDYVSQCSDNCIDKGNDAESIGKECADTYTRAVGCFGDLSCDEYMRWDSGDDAICETELTSFTENCPDLTFDFRG